MSDDLLNSDIQLVRNGIDALVKNFKINPLLYLNESDIQSELFSILLEYFRKDDSVIRNPFVWGTNKPQVTSDIITRRVHSELLLPEGRIDLAILDLKAVRVAFNSKGRFGYIQLDGGGHIFIEIKASRTNRSCISSKLHWFNLISSDIRKLESYTHKCFLLCFDFNRLLDENAIKSLLSKQPQNVEIIYCVDDFENFYFKS